MKSLIHKKSGSFLIMTVAFFLIGCAGEPVKVDLPANHPANPQSPETAFIPLPNPFQESNPTAEQKSGSSSAMTHEQHPSTQQHQMTHQMDQINHDSRSSPEAEVENQHKEHN